MTFFRPDGELLVPLPPASSEWGGSNGRGHLRGTAISGALARATERVAESLEGADGFRPVRWTLDLFRPAAMAPVGTEVSVVRQGRRLRLIDSTLLQDGRAVARASLLLLATGGPVHGHAWRSPLPEVPAVPADLRPATDEPTLYRSEHVGWTGSAEGHENADRKGAWYLAEPVVEGEDSTPLQHVAFVADGANLVTSWGTLGVEFINADATLTLTRLPAAGEGVGLTAAGRVEQDGIAVGRATMFDRHGPLGTVMVSTLANGDNAVDPRHAWPERGAASS